jgi:hypothetical protein
LKWQYGRATGYRIGASSASIRRRLANRNAVSFVA